MFTFGKKIGELAAKEKYLSFANFIMSFLIDS